MNLGSAKVFYFCIGFVLCVITCDALSAKFDSDISRGELYLVVQWNSVEDLIVLNPIFEENHPLYGLDSFSTVQEQIESVTEQKRSYVLDPQWTNIPKASLKILRSGKMQEIMIAPIEIKGELYSVHSVLPLLPLFGFLFLLLIWKLKPLKLSKPDTDSLFSRESAVQAAKTGNWSLLFEILSSNVPWRSELDGLPLEQWQQQWQFASREPSTTDRQKIIESLQRSNDDELREIVINKEDKILSEVLED